MTQSQPLIGAYVMFDAQDRRIYIGASRDVHRRIKEHHGKWWWPRVARIEVHETPNWEAARLAERALIARFNPEHNRQLTDPSARLGNAVRGSLLRLVLGATS